MSATTAHVSPNDGARIQCDHCSLPVPRGLVEQDNEKQFCCSGCRTAYQVIHEYELDRYYTLRDKSSQPIPEQQASCEAFDSPVYLDRWTRSLDDATLRTARFAVGGMHCPACVWLLERLPRVEPGVSSSRVILSQHVVDVIYDTDEIQLSSIARAIYSLGYQPHIPRSSTSHEVRQRDDRRSLIQLGIAGACAANVMLLAVALYAGALADMSPNHTRVIRWMSMGIGIVSVLGPGRVFFRGAWNHIRTRSVGLDIPIAIALSVGALWSVISTLRNTGHVYYDSLSVLVFALLLARFLQQRQQRWAISAIEHVLSLVPAVAHLVDATDTFYDVPVDALEADHVVVVMPGESIPADGTIIAGSSHLNMSILTGESRPTNVTPGDVVFAGTQNETAELRVRVEHTGRSTRISRLMELMEEGAQRKAPIVDLADRATAWFVAIVMLLAIGTWIGTFHLGADVATERMVSLLIVTCPCALGLATPLAFGVALGRAARSNILIKSGAALQSLAGRGQLLLDKTGTVTEGAMRVVRSMGNNRAMQLAGALERDVPHPIARAIADISDHADGFTVEHVRYDIGSGVAGVVDGCDVVVGTCAYVHQTTVANRADIQHQSIAHSKIDGHEQKLWLQSCIDDSVTPVCIAVDGVVCGMVGVGDAIREEARECVRQIRAMGWETGLLSGDQQEIVENVARDVGIEHAIGGATPERKLDIVSQGANEKMTGNHTTVMVGDGVNDAAALAAATVGIAVHGGAEASLDAADVYLQNPGLGDIVTTLQISRRAMATVKANLAISFIYNAGAAGAAMFGYISPLAAAVIMPISSLTVVLNSLRSARSGR